MFQSTHECDEEGNNVDDPKCEARLKHRASLVDIIVEIAAAGRYSSIEVATIRLRNEPHDHHTSDESADEEQVHECNEERIMTRTQITNQREERPCQR